MASSVSPIRSVKVTDRHYPAPLQHIHRPPKTLYYCGPDPTELSTLLERPRLAIVGTRRITSYGRKVTAELASRIAEAGVVIVTGLAFGVDVLAHRATLEVGGSAIAVMPGGLDNIVPVAHNSVARAIVQNGGCLISEQPPGQKDIYRGYFVARNRIVSGLSQAVLIIEAGQKSGALHTAAFAMEQGRDVLVVPGNIDSPASVGTNNLLEQGAKVVTKYQDVLEVLGLTTEITLSSSVRGANQQEQLILDLLVDGHNSGEELLTSSGLESAQFAQTLTMLEISGKIRPLGANIWAVR